MENSAENEVFVKLEPPIAEEAEESLENTNSQQCKEEVWFKQEPIDEDGKVTIKVEQHNFEAAEVEDGTFTEINIKDEIIELPLDVTIDDRSNNGSKQGAEERKETRKESGSNQQCSEIPLMYSYDITKHIQIVTIDEEERQIEHKEILSTRQHMSHVCENCALGFVVQDAFTMHMKIHEPESGSHECEVCHTWLKSADMLYRHRLRHYRRYRCLLCADRFKDKDRAACHVMTDHQRQAFHCNDCGKGFKYGTLKMSDSDSENNIRDEITEPSLKKVKFQEDIHKVPREMPPLIYYNAQATQSTSTSQRVNKKSDSQNLRAQRYREAHRDEINKRKRENYRKKLNLQAIASTSEFIKIEPAPCEEDSSKQRPQYLKRHTEQYHTKPHRLECPVCGKVFHERGWYRTHVRTHNAEVKMKTVNITVTCAFCSRNFRTKASLKRHLVTHEDTECHICAARCTSRNELGQHYLNVHNEPYKGAPDETCPLCLRVCATRAMLRHHMRRMHTDRTKKYQCDHCQRLYLTKGELRSHITWSHGAAGARGGHACACGRLFRSPSLLRSHRARFHAPAPPPRDHACDHCGKAFGNKQVLNRHKKSHSDEMYPCNECGLLFKTQPYVKVHYQIKHLNMTRAQIKEQRKMNCNRTAPINIQGRHNIWEPSIVKDMDTDGQETMVDPLEVQEGKVEVKLEREDNDEVSLF